MFSGIVTHIGIIKKIQKKNKNCVFLIESKMKFNKKELGSSISCSGVCLTLEKYNKNVSQFYLSKETLKRSIFKLSKIGDFINLEKSLTYGNRISGHFVQGHVDTTARVLKMLRFGKSLLLTFNLNAKYKKYLVHKGSIAINGVSFTISKIYENKFQISVIPHTLKFTNIIKLRVNNMVNIEFDVLGKYIKNFIK